MLKKREVLERLHILKNNLERRPVKKDSPSLYYLSRKYFGSWSLMMTEAGYTCIPPQKPIIPTEMNLSLSYFLGLISTDGHIQSLQDKGIYRVMLYTSEKEEVELLLNLIYTLFKYKASVRERITGFSDRPNYEIYISSKKIAFFLNSLGIPFGAKYQTIRVPKSVYKKPYFWHYLRGVFDGDGSIIFSKGNSVFKISSGSIGLLNELKDLLNKESFISFSVSLENKGVLALRTNLKKDIQKIHSLIYDNATFFYSRKRIKWSKQYV